MSDWPYKSQQALVDSGYKFRGFVPCPICEKMIAIYQISDHFPQFVECDTFKLHIDRYKHAAPTEIDHKSAAAGEKES
jgi:hypothetical protein